MEKDTLIQKIAQIVGEENLVQKASEQKRYLEEWRNTYHGTALVIVRPQNTQQICALMHYANMMHLEVIIQGGNTGLVGGQIPDQSSHQILLSLERLRAIRRFSPEDYSICVEAGVSLESLNLFLAEKDFFYPLSISSQGSCQIGGTIATNAGGMNVLAYGMTRNSILGLEIILANGEKIDSLRCLHKDNMGYDLKQLFIGCEGSLGIITAATLKIRPLPRYQATALVAFQNIYNCIKTFHFLKRKAGSLLTAYEVMPRVGIGFVLHHGQDQVDPLPKAYPWYGLIELSHTHDSPELTEYLEASISDAYAQNRVEDAIISYSLTQREEIWALRHYFSEAQKKEGASLKHDISVPLSTLPDLIDRAETAARNCVPGCRPVFFGHVGDGNIHLNVTQPEGMAPQAFLRHKEEMAQCLYAIVMELGGSLAAEHGVGQMKRSLLQQTRSPAEVLLMKGLKKLLDPENILNPGRVLDMP